MTKKDIKFIPFEKITEDYEESGELEEIISSFVREYSIKNSWSWLGPQILAHLGTYIPYKDSVQFLKHNIGRDPRELGIYRFLNKVNRSVIMEKQTLREHLPLCALVPPYMAAKKLSDNIPYSYWENPEPLMSADLWEASQCDVSHVTREDALAGRTKGLVFRGKQMNPQTYHTLNNLHGTVLKGLPRLAKVMVTQIWCAHPANRHKYMILDPADWDSMPEPLISTEILASNLESKYTPNTPKTKFSDIPWI